MSLLIGFAKKIFWFSLLSLQTFERRLKARVFNFGCLTCSVFQGGLSVAFPDIDSNMLVLICMYEYVLTGRIFGTRIDPLKFVSVSSIIIISFYDNDYYFFYLFLYYYLLLLKQAA